MSDIERCEVCGYPLDVRPDGYGIDCIQPCKVCELKKQKSIQKECDDCPFSPVRELKAELAKAKRDVGWWQKKWCNREHSTEQVTRKDG